MIENKSTNEQDEFSQAKQRAAIALLKKIETGANSTDDNHYEIRQLSKAYREIVGPPVETIVAEVGTTLDDVSVNHVAALEHFYDCVRFDCHLPPRIGPVTYEDVNECLDAARGRYNTINAELLAANLELGSIREMLNREHVPQAATIAERAANEVTRLAESGGAVSTIANLRNEIQAANEDLARANECVAAWQKEGAAVRDALGLALRDDPAAMARLLKADLKAIRVQLDGVERSCANAVAMLEVANEELAEREAEAKAICASLQEAIKPTGLDIKVDSYMRCKDAIRALAIRAEGLKLVRDALADVPGIDVTLRPDLVVRRLIDKHNEALGNITQIAAERDQLRGVIIEIQDAIASAIADPNRPPMTGSKSDLAKAVTAAIAQSQDMAKELEKTRGALHIANAQLAAANSNLEKALKLQGLPEALAPLMRAAAKIIAFWRRGDESYQLAAKELEKAMETTIGESWARFKAMCAGTNEIGAIVGVALHDAKKDEPIAIDPRWGGFPMNEGYETTREAVDTAVARAAMPNIFDCGCSKHKVTAGLCDVYDASGKARADGGSR